jgi:solute carrier family 25 protein 16
MSLIYREGATPSFSPTTVSSAAAAPTLFTRYPLLNFYRGFTVTMVGMVPYAGTSFLVWGYLRSKFLPPSPESKSGGSGKRKSTPIADLGLGAASGMLAQTASYPFEVVRRRMQVGGLTNPGRWMRWGETVRQVWRDATARSPTATGLGRAFVGMQGFYVGLTIGYLKVVPMTAVSYMVWEAGKRTLGV